MDNLILFVNAFLSYLLVYIIALALIVTAILLGIRFRKHKDAKKAASAIESKDTE